MVLRNFYGWLYSAIVAQRAASWSEVNASVLNTSGNHITIGYQPYKNNNDMPYVVATMSFTSMYLYVGSGAAEPAYDDYCLTEQITDVSNATTTCARAFENNYAKCVLTYTGTYTGEETTTIREIGIYKNIYSGSNATSPVLLTHSLLNDPITLKPGDAFTVETELTFSARE